MLYIEGYNLNRDKEQQEPEDDYHIILVDRSNCEFLKKLEEFIYRASRFESVYFMSSAVGRCIPENEASCKNYIQYHMALDNDDCKLLLSKIHNAIKEWQSEVNVPVVNHLG